MLLDGYDLKKLPLVERKQILQSLLPESDIIKYSDSFDDGIALYDQMKKISMEGIVAIKMLS